VVSQRLSTRTERGLKWTRRPDSLRLAPRCAPRRDNRGDQRAYRRLARALHPDAHPGGSEAKPVQAGRHGLRDAGRSRGCQRYDAMAGGRGPGSAAVRRGAGRTLETFFGGNSVRRRGWDRHGRRVRDLEQVIDLSFDGRPLFGKKSAGDGSHRPCPATTARGTGAGPRHPRGDVSRVKRPRPGPTGAQVAGR